MDNSLDENLNNDSRFLDRQNFLNISGWATAEQAPLPGDASFRHYIRLNKSGVRAMLMDAPPATENVQAFVAIANHLLDLGFRAPKILAEDQDLGFLIIEDFGDDTFTNLLAAGVDETALYALATDTLADLHKNEPPYWLPPYNDQRLLTEASLLLDWFMVAHGLELSCQDRAVYDRLWLDLFARVHAGPKTLVLRDYHVDNLMQLDGRTNTQACGLLDFQDARAGHPAYDLMSLLQDARRDISADLQSAMKKRYHATCETEDIAAFDIAYTILAAQRHAKVIGIFTRLDRRDGKPVYLKHIDRLWHLFEQSLDHPVLEDLKIWVDAHIPKDKRCAAKDQT